MKCCCCKPCTTVRNTPPERTHAAPSSPRHLARREHHLGGFFLYLFPILIIAAVLASGVGVFPISPRAWLDIGFVSRSRALCVARREVCHLGSLLALAPSPQSPKADSRAARGDLSYAKSLRLLPHSLRDPAESADDRRGHASLSLL